MNIFIWVEKFRQADNPWIILKIETTSLSETSVHISQYTQRHTQRHWNLKQYRCKEFQY
jgi:hypothetical protein